MKKFLAALALTTSIQAAPPAIAVIKTGWEQTAKTEFVYYGLPRPQLRQRYYEYSNKPVAVVHREGAYWVYQFEGKEIVPATSRKAGMKEVEHLASRDTERPNREF